MCETFLLTYQWSRDVHKYTSEPVNFGQFHGGGGGGGSHVKNMSIDLLTAQECPQTHFKACEFLVTVSLWMVGGEGGVMWEGFSVDLPVTSTSTSQNMRVLGQFQ